MKTLQTALTLLAALPSLVYSQAWLSCPPSFNPNPSRDGVSQGPCEAGLANAPVYPVRAGDRLKVGWISNGYAGGFVRLSLVPEASAGNQSAFDANVLKQTCFGYDERPGEVIFGTCSHPCNGRPGCQWQQQVGDNERYDTTLTIPYNLANGNYVLQWIAVIANDATPYFSCSKLSIQGGNPNLNCAAPAQIPSTMCIRGLGPDVGVLLNGARGGAYCYAPDQAGAIDDKIADRPVNFDCDPRQACAPITDDPACLNDITGIADPLNPKQVCAVPTTSTTSTTGITATTTTTTTTTTASTPTETHGTIPSSCNATAYCQTFKNQCRSTCGSRADASFINICYQGTVATDKIFFQCGCQGSDITSQVVSAIGNCQTTPPTTTLGSYSQITFSSSTRTTSVLTEVNLGTSATPQPTAPPTAPPTNTASSTPTPTLEPGCPDTVDYCQTFKKLCRSNCKNKASQFGNVCYTPFNRPGTYIRRCACQGVDVTQDIIAKATTCQRYGVCYPRIEEGSRCTIDRQRVCSGPDVAKCRRGIWRIHECSSNRFCQIENGHGKCVRPRRRLANPYPCTPVNSTVIVERRSFDDQDIGAPIEEYYY